MWSRVCWTRPGTGSTCPPEIDHLDSHTVAGLAFACVGNSAAFVNTVLNKVLEYMNSNPLCEVVDSSMEMV